MNPFVQEMEAKRERKRLRRIAVLKRVLKELAQLPRTPPLIGDMEELEAMINELGGDSRTGAHRAIREGKEK